MLEGAILTHGGAMVQGWRALRVWLIALLLAMGAIPAGAKAAPVPPPANAQSEIVTLQAQVAALKDQRDLEKRLATLEGKTAAEDRARDNLTNAITILGFIIAIIGIVTGYASYVIAGERAAKEARETTEKALEKIQADFDKKAGAKLTEIDTRLTLIGAEFDKNVTLKLAEVDTRIAEVTATASDVTKRADETAANLQMTNDHLAEMARLRARMALLFTEAEEGVAVIRAGARLSEELGRSPGAGGDRKEATEAQKQTILAAVAESTDQPEKQWSVDQFKAAIGKARYVDEDWTEALRLAAAMEALHGEDTDARLYALSARGDAARKLGRNVEALEAYRTVTAITTVDPPASQQRDYIWAAHHAAQCLLILGRATEAEALLREQLPICDRVDGAEDSGTLVTRHELARAILNQGRAAEAEAMLRELLSITERVDGAEASGTLVTRHTLACAILDQGRAAEAEAMQGELLTIAERVNGAEHSHTLVYRYSWADALVRSGDAAGARAAIMQIPNPVPNSDWLPRWDAALAFVGGRVADALGDTDAADAQLARAKEILASIYPDDHIDRQRLRDYMANRPAPPKDPSPDA